MLKKQYQEQMREEIKKQMYDALKKRAHDIAAATIDHEQDESIDPRKRHVCASCGKVFKSKVELYTHKYENLWEDYHKVSKKRGRPHLCIFCGKDFLTEDDFMEHWFNEKDHEDYALTFLQMGQVKKSDPTAEWLISPTEEILLERRIKHDPEMKACKKNHQAGSYIADTIAFRVRNNEMIVAECWGIPGSGKSSSVLSLIYTHVIPESYKRLARDWLEACDENYAAALIYRDEKRAEGRDIGIGLAAIELMRQNGVWEEPEVHITFSVAETLRAIRLARELDVIMQDEDPGLMGRGSETAKTKIQTILKLMRKKRISFFFISPVRIQYITTSNLAFEVTHKRNPLSSRVTRGILYDREHVSLGWYQHKILEKMDRIKSVKKFQVAERVPRTVMDDILKDEELITRIQNGEDVHLPVLTIYELLKDANLDKIQYQMGAEGVEINWDLVDEDVRRVYDGMIGRLVEQGRTPEQALRVLGEMPVSKIVRRVPAYDVKGEVEYQTLVAEETYEYIQRELTKSYIDREYPNGESSEYEGGSYIEETEEEAQLPSEFALDDMSYIPLIEQEIKHGKFKIEWKYLDAYRRYLLKETDWKDYALIAASLGLSSPGNISDQFKTIKGRISELRGGLFEIEILRQYAQSDVVVSMEPRPIFSYPDGIAPEGQADRKVVLIDGRIRLCAWKCYGGNNSTIELGRKRRGEYVPCPEIIEARRLIEMGGDPDRIEVVIEGIMGKRRRTEDSFILEPEFFQAKVDPFTRDHSITIPTRGRMHWPPTVEQLTGIVPRIQEVKETDEEEDDITMSDV